MLSITNEQVLYFKRFLPSYSNILTTNLSINNIIFDKPNNIFTIETNENHNLLENEFVFLKNILYKEPIESFKLTNDISNLQQKFYEIKVLYKVNFNNNAIIYLKDFADTRLNNKFIIVSYENLIENDIEKIILKGYFENNEIYNVNIQNEGNICYNFEDEVFFNGDIEDIMFYNSSSFVGGCYNGLKKVEEIIDEKIFKVKLHNNENLIIPTYTDEIDFENAIIKKDIQIYSANSSEEEKQQFLSSLEENKAILFINRNSSDISNNNNNIKGTFQEVGSGMSFMKKTYKYDATLLFRVSRSPSQFILNEEANEIVEYFEDIFSSCVNSNFTSYDINFNNAFKIDVIYKSIFEGMSSVESFNNKDNIPFKQITYSFSITKRITNYGENQINQVGMPILNINIDNYNNSINDKTNITI